MALIPDERAITELAVFNTLIPQDDPGNLRVFGLPQEFHDRPVRIFVDHDRDLGTPNRDEALIVDPAQAVLVMDIGECGEHRILLVVRTQVFDQPYSVRADSYVHWDEWMEYAVVMEVPMFVRPVPKFRSWRPSDACGETLC